MNIHGKATGRVGASIAIGVLVLLAAWQAAVRAEATGDDTAVVRVGAFDNPPIVFRDRDGAYRGVAVDFLNDVAAREGWHLVYVYAPWPELLARLERGDIDLLTGIAWSEGRARDFSFTGETLVNNWGIVYRNPDVDITSMVDLGGKRIAMMRGSIHSTVLADTLRRFGISYELVEEDSYGAALEAVARGRADAAAVNRVFSLMHADRYRVAVTPIVFNPVEVRYAATHGGTALVRALDRHLAQQKQDAASAYRRSLDHWLRSNPAATGIPVAWAFWALVLVAGLALVAAILNRYLQHQVRLRTGELRTQRDNAQRYLDTVQVMIVALDRDGCMTLVNRRACEILGYGERELLGRDWFGTCVPERQRDELRRRFRQAVEGGIEPERYTQSAIANRNGDQRLIAWSNSYVRDATGLCGVLSSGEDITERHRAQEELRASEEKFSKAFHSSPDAIMISRHDDGRIIEVNEGFERSTGYSADQVAGRTTLELGMWVDPADRDRMLKRLMTDGYVRDAEFRIRRRDGAVRECLLSAEPVLIGDTTCLLSVTRDVTDRKAQLAALEYQANHDSLTGLPNRQLLYRNINDAIVSAARDRSALALLLMDVNRFKEINDTLGHHAGDNMLRQMGQRLRGLFSEGSAMVARLGGDEYAVLIAGVAGDSGVVRDARSILEVMRRPFEIDGLNVEVGVSIGIAMYPGHGDSASSLMRCADVAMYLAKRNASGFALYSQEIDEHTPRRLALTTELGSAIRGGQLVLHFQPKVELASDSVVGVEALVRWCHPRHGMVPPGQFIPLAETSELLSPLTAWVIEAALTQWREWHGLGLQLKVAANLSTRNLVDRDLPGQIESLLRRYDADAGALELEITESAIMADPERALQTLKNLHDMGIGLFIDDFGTGYSSLAYLRRLPIDALKIDLSFVRNMVHSEQDSIIVRSTINLAHNLGRAVVAEGVEDIETLDLLRGYGCDQAQGYFISRPQPAAELTGWLRRRGRPPARPLPGASGGRRG